MDEKYLLVLLLLLSFSWRESKKETNPHLNFDNFNDNLRFVSKMLGWSLLTKSSSDKSDGMLQCHQVLT